jgi:3-isopropylmalate/(R)-2-methylmalate dehydratase small subunit
MEPIKLISSKVTLLLVNNIDTDQIIPARFLKVTEKTGLGVNLFSDWRYQEDGSPKEDFVLNQPVNFGAQILLSGDNFGSGSSREHAPWALTDYGFKAIISTSFADIFKNNALKNGLLPVQVSPENHRYLVEKVQQNPDTKLRVDLEKMVVGVENGESWTFPIDSFSRECLLNGVDELGYLLNLEDKIAAYEKAM